MRSNKQIISNENFNKIIIYDGICVLCSRSIAFIDKNDKKKEFEYLAYSSSIAKELLEKNNIDFTLTQFIVYINNGKCYNRSRAVLEILKDLGGFWRLMFIFVIIPPFIRNYAYNIVAKNRHRWFRSTTV